MTIPPNPHPEQVEAIADALDCFWNAALTDTHAYDDPTANAVMAGVVSGVAAVANHLREIASLAKRPADDGERSRAIISVLAEALERIRDLGSDGEHSGDRHAHCRLIARQALSSASTDTGAREGFWRERAATFAHEQRDDGNNDRPVGWDEACDHIAHGFRADLNPFAITPNTDTPTDEYRRGVEDAARVVGAVRLSDGEHPRDTIATAIRALSPEPLGTAKERGE